MGLPPLWQLLKLSKCKHTVPPEDKNQSPLYEVGRKVDRNTKTERMEPFWLHVTNKQGCYLLVNLQVSHYCSPFSPSSPRPSPTPSFSSRPSPPSSSSSSSSSPNLPLLPLSFLSVTCSEASFLTDHGGGSISRDARKKPFLSMTCCTARKISVPFVVLFSVSRPASSWQTSKSSLTPRKNTSNCAESVMSVLSSHAMENAGNQPALRANWPWTSSAMSSTRRVTVFHDRLIREKACDWFGHTVSVVIVRHSLTKSPSAKGRPPLTNAYAITCPSGIFLCSGRLKQSTLCGLPC